jgi:2-methylcitrate dehydratase PrpD
MDAAYLFAKNLVVTNYDDIPRDVVEATKKQTLDILGVALAGSSKPGVKELLELITEWGGKEESTIFCSGQKVPAPHAAQMNATMGHAPDYDDTHDTAIIHPSVVAVPTCLAVAEHRGKLSGREFITAAALGIDMICRLGLATTSPLKAGWHLTTLNGCMTAAGVAGRILGLDENGIVNAIGIAYHQSCGNGQCVLDGALTKRMGPGFAIRGGIAAALMAEKGITGAKDSLEGKYGLFNLYHQGTYDSRILTVDLGKRFEGINVSIKPYPCCRVAHSYIDAALSIVNQHNIKAEEVREVTVICGELANELLCVPFEAKCKPRTVVDAQFSIPWTVATAIVRRQVAMEHFTEAAIKSQDILEISGKTKVEPDTGPGSTVLIQPGRVKIVTKNGETYYKEINHALGSPQRPLTFDECARKFRDCASYAIKRLPDKQIDRVVELVGQLEKVDDIGEIIELLG